MQGNCFFVFIFFSNLPNNKQLNNIVLFFLKTTENETKSKQKKFH
jgi:hypothetical protein